MSRPTASYVGSKLSHPIRLAAFRSGASFLSVTQALELSADLISACLRAIREDDNRDAVATRLRDDVQ